LGGACETGGRINVKQPPKGPVRGPTMKGNAHASPRGHWKKPQSERVKTQNNYAKQPPEHDGQKK